MSEAVVDQAGAGVFSADTKQADMALGDAQGQGGGGGGGLEYGEILGLGFTRGVDAAELHVIGGEGQASTLGLAQEPDFESRVSGLLKHDLAVGGRAAGETDAAQAEQAVARFAVARRHP